MTIQQHFHQLRQSLRERYDEREASLIADMALEKATGFNRSQRMMKGQEPIGTAALTALNGYEEALLSGVPVQYALEEAWFMNRPFFVNKHVLIPRPETEELVQWVLENKSFYASFPHQHMIDIGTGSGCIPVSLKSVLPHVHVHALDVSEEALEVAKRNARSFQADIHFLRQDFREQEDWNGLPDFHTIVSNPPYIPWKEKMEMEQHVVEQEPHLALFVPNEDPYLFYRLLAEFSQRKLVPGGSVYMEIHASGGTETMDLFSPDFFEPVELRKDLQGKDRMVKATRKRAY